MPVWDDSFGVMRFGFDLILTQFYTRNLVKNKSYFESHHSKGIVSVQQGKQKIAKQDIRKARQKG